MGTYILQTSWIKLFFVFLHIFTYQQILRPRPMFTTKESPFFRHIRTLFCGLKGYEAFDYATLLLMAASMPIAWRLGMWAMIGVFCSSIFATFISHKVGNNRTTLRYRIGFVLMMAFFCVYFCAGCYSQNQTYGWSTTTGKLSFLIFPLSFLLCDRPYLNSRRIRMLFYTLGSVVIIRFLFGMVKVVVGLSQGVPLSSMMEENFIDMHHSYIALYASVAAGFGYSEIMHLVKKSRWGTRGWLLLLGVAIMAFTTVMVNSRAGMVFMAMLLVVGIVDYVVTRRTIVPALAVLMLTALIAVGVYQVIPKEYKRFTYAFNEIRAGRSGDCRPIMIRSGLEAAQGHELFGYGSGDYEEPLQQRFLANGFQEGYDKKFGSHNQYIETLLECGVVGLSIMIAMLLWPLFITRRNHPHRRLIYITVAAVMIEIFFESILGRQMGILFVSYFYCLILELSRNRCGDIA